jgi:hypothetical protein
MRSCEPSRFRFVLLRGPADFNPQAPVGLVYRPRAHREHVWVMCMNPGAATHHLAALLLALLTVDQALQVLPPQPDPPAPGIGLLLADGSLRDGRGRPLPKEVLAEVRRIADELEGTERYYLEKLRRYFNDEGLPGWFEPVPESYPGFDAALEQAFAPEPPILPVRIRAAG